MRVLLVMGILPHLLVTLDDYQNVSPASAGLFVAAGSGLTCLAAPLLP
jgi:hypothetical protein